MVISTYPHYTYFVELIVLSSPEDAGRLRLPRGRVSEISLFWHLDQDRVKLQCAAINDDRRTTTLGQVNQDVTLSIANRLA
jgi:hypothetical protein